LSPSSVLWRILCNFLWKNLLRKIFIFFLLKTDMLLFYIGRWRTANQKLFFNKPEIMRCNIQNMKITLFFK
jgi:hypothetical protein